MSLDALFRPFTVKSLTLPNRIVMAPMTRSFSPNGVPTEDVAAYYRRRAEGGVGLIVTEGTVVERPAARSDVQTGLPRRRNQTWTGAPAVPVTTIGTVVPASTEAGAVMPMRGTGGVAGEGAGTLTRVVTRLLVWLPATAKRVYSSSAT